MGLLSLMLEALMLTGMIGAAVYVVRELLKPECIGLANESCASANHSTLIIMLILLVIVIGGFLFRGFRKRNWL